MTNTLNTAQAADLLDITMRGVQKLVTRKILPAGRFGKALTFEREAVEAYARTRRAPGRPKQTGDTKLSPA